MIHTTRKNLTQNINHFSWEKLLRAENINVKELNQNDKDFNERNNIMSKASELIERLKGIKEAKVDDFNGLWKEFESKYSKIAKKLLSGDMADRFWDGINSVSKMSVGGKDFLFIETPGHGWIVDMSGEVVGEEDGGFDDKSLNKDLKSVFDKMKTVIESAK